MSEARLLPFLNSTKEKDVFEENDASVSGEYEEEIEKRKFLPQIDDWKEQILKDSSFVDLEKLDTILGSSSSREESMSNTSDYEKYLEQRFQNMEERLSHQEDRISHKFDSLAQKVDAHNAKMDDHLSFSKQMIDLLSQRNQNTDERLNNIEQRISNMRWWFVGSIIALFVGFAGSLIALAQLQNNWIQQYIDLIMKLGSG